MTDTEAVTSPVPETEAKSPPYDPYSAQFAAAKAKLRQLADAGGYGSFFSDAACAQWAELLVHEVNNAATAPPPPPAPPPQVVTTSEAVTNPVEPALTPPT